MNAMEVVKEKNERIPVEMYLFVESGTKKKQIYVPPLLFIEEFPSLF